MILQHLRESPLISKFRRREDNYVKPWQPQLLLPHCHHLQTPLCAETLCWSHYIPSLVKISPNVSPVITQRDVAIITSLLQKREWMLWEFRRLTWGSGSHGTAFLTPSFPVPKLSSRLAELPLYSCTENERWMNMISVAYGHSLAVPFSTNMFKLVLQDTPKVFQNLSDQKKHPCTDCHSCSNF